MWRDVLLFVKRDDDTSDLAHLGSELLKYKKNNVHLNGSFSADSNMPYIKVHVPMVRSICKILYRHRAYASIDYTGVGVSVHIKTKGAQDQCGKDEEKNSPINATFAPVQWGCWLLVASTRKFFHKAFDK